MRSESRARLGGTPSRYFATLYLLPYIKQDSQILDVECLEEELGK